MADADRDDRYAGLMRGLHARPEPAAEAVGAGAACDPAEADGEVGGSLPVAATRGTRSARWHPVIGRLLIIALILAAGYVTLVAALGYLRESRVDTWAGPDTAVQSGQQLAGCDKLANVIADSNFPSWIRYGGSVYRKMAAVVPVGLDARPGMTRFTETGYQLDRLRLVLMDDTPAGVARDQILVLQERGVAGQPYERTSCR